MSKPHIVLKREGSTSDGWCKHYAGFFKAGIGEGKKTHCEAGVEYASVEKKVEFSYSYPGEHVYDANVAHPCFKREHHLTDGCPKCQFKTPEEIKAHRDEMMAFVNRVDTARQAIISDLEQRRKRGEEGAILNLASDPEVEDGPRNFISGAGIIECPVCKKGKLRYSRAAYNGHVHARCDTKGCVAWME